MSPGTLSDPIDPASEAGELADLFHALSQAVDDYRQRADLPPEITSEQRALLKRQAQELEDLSHHFTAEAIGATLQSIQADLAKIKGVTAEAKAQLGKLKTVSKVIRIATAGVSLGTAIASGNLGAIGSALKGIGQAVEG